MRLHAIPKLLLESAEILHQHHKWIYFTSNRTGDYQIWKMPVSGGDAVQITHNVGFAAQESVDGAYVFYTQTQRQPSALWRLPVSGGQPVKVLEGWSPYGQ